MTATIRRVARPRGELTAEQQRRLTRLQGKADAGVAEYRAAVVETLNEGASFAEVAAFTGHSTNTLQAWKKAASDEQ